MNKRNERVGRRALELAAIDARIFGTAAPVRTRAIRPRKSAVLLLTLAVVGLTALAASAGHAHFRHGSSISCTFSQTTFANDTVTCTGTGGLAGLGNANVKFELSGAGSATYFCKNPGNGTEAKGQNKVPLVIPPTSITVAAGDIKNGNLAFFGPSGNTLGPDTATAVQASGKDAGCPNDSWTTRVDSVFWTSVKVSIQQPPGTEIFACTASDPNGLSGTVALSC